MTPSPHLLKALKESRSDISLEYTSLCSELDFQKKFKDSFKQHPFLWLGGAVGAGLLTTFLGLKPSPRLKPQPSLVSDAASTIGPLSKIGWLAGVLEVGKVLYPILRPLVVDLASHAAKAGLAKKGRP